jgi:hypothetical protein
MYISVQLYVVFPKIGTVEEPKNLGGQGCHRIRVQILVYTTQPPPPPPPPPRRGGRLVSLVLLLFEQPVCYNHSANALQDAFFSFLQSYTKPSPRQFSSLSLSLPSECQTKCKQRGSGEGGLQTEWPWCFLQWYRYLPPNGSPSWISKRLPLKRIKKGYRAGRICTFNFSFTSGCRIH